MIIGFELRDQDGFLFLDSRNSEAPFQLIGTFTVGTANVAWDLSYLPQYLRDRVRVMVLQSYNVDGTQTGEGDGHGRYHQDSRVLATNWDPVTGVLDITANTDPDPRMPRYTHVAVWVE